MKQIHGAVIYARYSTEHQHSIGEQVDACTKKCQALQLPVLGIYTDEGVSGTKLSRAGFDRMMADLRAGGADTLLIYDQSRLMRDVGGWLTVRKELQVMQVTVISATQEYVGGDIRRADTFLMESVQATFDQMHVLITREKTINKMRFMAQLGIHTGGVPALGYKAVAINETQKALVVAEDEAKIVRRIFQEYDEGRSYREIVSGLNADGITTKRGNRFGSNSLHDMLKNQLYIGIQVYGARPYRADGTRNSHAECEVDAIIREAPELQIIDKAVFERVQKRMAENKRTGAGRPASAREYPLKGKVFCGECGSAMAAVSSKKKGHVYFYYRCAKKDRTNECNGKPIRCDELEKTVVEQVRAMVGCPDVQERVMAYLQAERERLARTGLDQLRSLQGQKAEVRRKMDNIIAAIEAGNYIAAMNNRLHELQAEHDALDGRMMAMGRRADVARIPTEEFEAVFDRFCRNAIADADAVLAVVDRVEIYNDRIKIYTLFARRPDTGTDGDGEEVVIIEGTPSGVPEDH